MADYAEVLEKSYEDMREFQDENLSRLEYLAEHIFDFATYEDYMAELFATKMVEVCQAISDKTTFDYIDTDEGRMWYLLMVNMPFLAGRLDWGTSIRGAWWDLDGQNLHSCGLLGADGKQQCEWRFTPEEWEGFFEGIIAFAAKQERQA